MDWEYEGEHEGEYEGEYEGELHGFTPKAMKKTIETWSNYGWFTDIYLLKLMIFHS